VQKHSIVFNDADGKLTTMIDVIKKCFNTIFVKTNLHTHIQM